MENELQIQIGIGELKRILELLADHIRNESGQTLTISEDYYWEVDERQLYNPTQDPDVFNLGQLSDDWQRLSKILHGEDPPIGYALVWLGAVLRAIGQKYVP